MEFWTKTKNIAIVFSFFLVACFCYQNQIEKLMNFKFIFWNIYFNLLPHYFLKFSDITFFFKDLHHQFKFCKFKCPRVYSQVSRLILSLCPRKSLFGWHPLPPLSSKNTFWPCQYLIDFWGFKFVSYYNRILV